jgi:hypothetical protein
MTNLIICCVFAITGILGQLAMGAIPAIMM